MTITQLERRIDQLEEALQRIKAWSEAYPIECFPEPDWKKANEVLEANGISLSAISASNMRHVISRVREIINSVLSEKL